ncbi:MAG: hypothetical protein WCO77_10265, partial [bacterium]
DFPVLELVGGMVVAILPAANLQKPESCPFKDGLNPLWRTQLMATAIESDPTGRYKKVYASVVHHPGNTNLTAALQSFKDLIAPNDRFFSFTSNTLLEAAEKIDTPSIQAWSKWYRDLYYWEE